MMKVGGSEQIGTAHRHEGKAEVVQQVPIFPIVPSIFTIYKQTINDNDQKTK